MPEETPQPETAAPAAAAASPPARGGRRTLLVALAAGVALAGGLGGAGWYLGLLPGGRDAEAKAKAEAPEPLPKVGALQALDPFIANLGDEDGKRYLKASLQVEFFGPRVPDEFTHRLPQVRDLLLTLFTSKTFAEVRTPQGKAVLRDEIINRINRALRQDVVKAVYFTEFIVQ
jgi:flagellar FliL protein